MASGFSVWDFNIAATHFMRADLAVPKWQLSFGGSTLLRAGMLLLTSMHTASARKERACHVHDNDVKGINLLLIVLVPMS